ncbi:unnamed protein product, partial [Allacma fusca]
FQRTPELHVKMLSGLQRMVNLQNDLTEPSGFEPSRADPIGLAVEEKADRYIVQTSCAEEKRIKPAHASVDKPHILTSPTAQPSC